MAMHDPFPSSALRQIVDQTRIRDIKLFDQLESTSGYASQQAVELEGELPLVILARHQTGGRGRGDHRWHATDGALTFTAMYGEADLNWPRQRWPQLSLVAAVAVAETLQTCLSQEHLALKWPNDVFCQGRKISGILVEARQSQRWMMNLGIGVNVNNPLDDAPAEVQSRAISMIDLLDTPLFLPEVLLGILTRLEQWMDVCRESMDPILAYWHSLCLLNQRTIEVRQGERFLRGACLGIDPEGRLMIETGGAIQAITTGEVVRY